MKQVLTLLFSLFLCHLSHGQTVLAQHHFEAADITEVIASGAFCDVYISKGDQVVFDGRIEGSGDKDDFIIASVKRGDQVLFKVESKSGKSWEGNTIERARFDIAIPDDVALTIDNTSGDVQVKNLSGAEYVLETTSGDMQISSLKGTTRIKTTSGDVDVKDITGEVKVRSTSGDHTLSDITGNLETRTTSGDIDIYRVKGNLDAGATSGDIEIRDLKGAVSVATTSGNIDASQIDLTGNSAAKATSGDIFFSFVNALEDIGFELRATSGDLDVGSVSAEDKLILKRGSFTFSGVTTSGDQEYKN